MMVWTTGCVCSGKSFDDKLSDVSWRFCVLARGGTTVAHACVKRDVMWVR